ncbi:MAG: DNA repair protein RecO [Ekhidna sp.]|nr:DNA repair protein RecO [Ekhidna sp.]
MIVKSKGIVLNYIKYGDTSIITRIFTEEHGYDSYIVNSIRSQKSGKSMGYFQPFSILDLVLYLKESRNLQRISEFKSHIPLHSIHQDLYKSTITLFLSEIFSKLLQSEQSPNPSLYAFAEASIHTFDQIRQGVANFHIQFLLKLTSYLGFEIENAEYLFSSTDKLMPAEDGHHLLQKMLKDPYGSTYNLNRSMRGEMINVILSFYEHHLHISKPKSLKVIKSIFD